MIMFRSKRDQPDDVIRSEMQHLKAQGFTESQAIKLILLQGLYLEGKI